MNRRNYAPTIFQSAGFSFQKSLLLTLIVNLVNAVFVISASQFLDDYGRKLLLKIGIVVTMAGTLLLSLGFYFGLGENIGLFLTSCLLTSVGFSIGFGTVCWLISSEMFPVSVRAQALSISTMIRNACEFTTNFLFLELVDSIGESVTFSIFFILGIIAIFVTQVFLVESKHREPHEILADLHENLSNYCCYGSNSKSKVEREVSPHLKNIKL